MTRTPAVNASTVFGELPIPQRMDRIRSLGFDAVEFWWPFATARPGEDEVEAFASAVEESGLELIGLNVFAGDMKAGDRGILSWPGRRGELIDSATIAVDLGRRLGTRRFNALYGNRLPSSSSVEQDAVAADHLRELADMVATIGGVVMLEPVSGAPAYPLALASDVIRVLDRLSAGGGPENIGMLFDLYHLAVNNDDVPAAISAYGDRAAHVQLADAPGRVVPGSGELPLQDWVRLLRHAGYRDRVALEFIDGSGDSLASFDLEPWKELS